MLWVTLRDENNSLHPGLERDVKHSLKEKASILSKMLSNEDIVEVVASGDELQHIIDNMRGVPYRLNVNNVHWRGEFARFIVENW